MGHIKKCPIPSPLGGIYIYSRERGINPIIKNVSKIIASDEYCEGRTPDAKSVLIRGSNVSWGME